jgi:hypothetical protein
MVDARPFSVAAEDLWDIAAVDILDDRVEVRAGIFAVAGGGCAFSSWALSPVKWIQIFNQRRKIVLARLRVGIIVLNGVRCTIRILEVALNGGQHKQPKACLQTAEIGLAQPFTNVPHLDIDITCR